MRRVASFDVFDTVLVRALGRPDTVFLLAGRRLARARVVSCTPEAFAHARRAADRLAYAKSGRDGRVGHEAICAELAALLGLDTRACRTVLATELELESEVLRASPVGQRLVAEARARGATIAYLSDMYLPSGFVRAQLLRHGFWEPGDHLYVSSEHLASKRSGGLFAVCARDLGVPASALDHHGNDPTIDLAGARRAGARAHLVADGNLNHYERLLTGSRGSAVALGPALAGAARLARLRVPARSQREVAIRDVATGVAAPLLVAYVLWLLSRCRRLGLRRLYFLSRDGQVLLEIARALEARLGLGIDLRYLYASRQAWNVAGLAGGEAADLSWLFTHSEEASARGLLERAGLGPADLGLDPAEAGRPLDAAERAALLDRLGRPPLRGLVADRAAGRAALLRAYLEQEGLQDGVPAAVVDVIARGSQHRTLCNLLPRPPLAFYIGRQRHPGDAAPVPAEAYLFDEQAGVGVPRFSGRDALLLAFTTADHGSLLGYDRRAGRITPVLASSRNEPALAWGLARYRRALHAVVEELVLDPGDLDSDVRGETVAVLEHFWARPTRAEAAAWGGFPFEYGSGGDARWNVLGAPYEWGELLGRLRGRAGRHWSAWPAGATANSRIELRLGLALRAVGSRVGR